MIYENTPTLMTERLMLRRFTEGDTEALLAILGDEATNAYLPWFPVDSLVGASSFLHDRFLSTYDSPSGYRYAICLLPSNTPIGYVWLSYDSSCDFGYGLASSYWHRGIATEAAVAVLQRVAQAGYTYVTATHDINNPRSGEVMRKLGMSYRYSYVEQWQPKNIPVTFRMYQLNLDGNDERVYWDYWNKYNEHFIEDC